MRDSPHYEAHSCARTHKEGGWVRGMCRDGQREPRMPHGRTQASWRAPRSVANMLASGAHFGGLLVANCSATVPGIELGSKRLRRPGAGASFKGTWLGWSGGKPAAGNTLSWSQERQSEKTGRSPPQSGACRRSPCRRRPNATGSGRCLYAGSIHRSVFRARVLAGLPAPHAGTGSRQHGRGATRIPTTDTNNGLCRAFRQRW